MCVEATFDFIRENILTWLRLGGGLLLPVCVLLSLHVYSIDNDSFLYGYGWQEALTWSDTNHPLSHGLLLVIGLCATMVLVYTLLLAQNAHALSRGLRALTPFVRKVFWRSLVSAVMLSALLWVCGGMSSWILVVLSIVLLVPLSLMPPVWMMEDVSWVKAVSKGMRLGFSSWFSLFFTILMVSVVGFVIILVVNVPWMGMQTVLNELIPINEGSGGGLLFLRTSLFVFSVVAYFCCFMMVSLTLISCVFHYGSVSEKDDDTSLESDIDHFDSL